MIIRNLVFSQGLPDKNNFFSFHRMQKYFLESIQRVQTNLRLLKSCDLESQKDWILSFMSHIDALVVEKSHDKNNIIFYCDILFVSIICLSGMDCLLPKKELLISLQDERIRLFPQAISVLIDRQMWKSISCQVCVNIYIKYFTFKLEKILNIVLYIYQLKNIIFTYYNHRNFSSYVKWTIHV